MTHEPERPPRQTSYEAEGVRQGTIVLRSRRRRTFFIAGLVGMVVLVLLLALLA